MHTCAQLCRPDVRTARWVGPVAIYAYTGAARREETRRAQQGVCSEACAGSLVLRSTGCKSRVNCAGADDDRHHLRMHRATSIYTGDCPRLETVFRARCCCNITVVTHMIYTAGFRKHVSQAGAIRGGNGGIKGRIDRIHTVRTFSSF